MSEFTCDMQVHKNIMSPNTRILSPEYWDLSFGQSSWGGSRGGGVQGSKDPPGPERGGPGPLFQNEENSIYYLQFYLIPPNKSL